MYPNTPSYGGYNVPPPTEGSPGIYPYNGPSQGYSTSGYPPNVGGVSGYSPNPPMASTNQWVNSNPQQYNTRSRSSSSSSSSSGHGKKPAQVAQATSANYSPYPPPPQAATQGPYYQPQTYHPQHQVIVRHGRRAKSNENEGTTALLILLAGVFFFSPLLLVNLSYLKSKDPMARICAIISAIIIIFEFGIFGLSLVALFCLPVCLCVAFCCCVIISSIVGAAGGGGGGGSSSSKSQKISPEIFSSILHIFKLVVFGRTTLKWYGNLYHAVEYLKL